MDVKLTEKEEAKLLLNQEVRVTLAQSQFHGQTGLVRDVMADGRTLEIELAHTCGKIVLLDVTFVGEIQERTQFAKTEQSLGPIANSVVQDTL
jgi:ribosomal protein L21E